MAPTLSASEVAKHNSQKSCWVIIEDHVYDVTDFLADHPGGSSIILRYAGKVELTCPLFLFYKFSNCAWL